MSNKSTSGLSNRRATNKSDPGNPWQNGGGCRDVPLVSPGLRPCAPRPRRCLRQPFRQRVPFRRLAHDSRTTCTSATFATSRSSSSNPHTFSALPSNQSYRPLVSTTLAIDYRLGRGLDPFVFHLSSFVFFAAQCVVLLFLYRRLMDLARPHPLNRWLALFAAAWYGLHTVNAETVNYVIARSGDPVDAGRGAGGADVLDRRTMAALGAVRGAGGRRGVREGTGRHGRPDPHGVRGAL